MGKIYAVLTGDIVKSTSRTSAEMRRVRSSLERAAKAIESAGWPGRRSGRLVRGEPDFFRGDSWQLLLADPRWALRSAVLIRADLQSRLGVDSRISIGLGPVSNVSTKRTSLSRGEAFSLSGQGLDEEMGARYRLAIVVPPAWRHPCADWLRVAARLCDSVIVQWQGRQVEVARLACLHPGASQAEIGELLDPPVSQQSVAKTMRSAGWPGVEDAMERFETIEELQP